MSTPNVVLLTIDTLRADRLGCYGYDRPITPNLDRLASQGIRFSQAITGGSWTQSAFPVILTSTYASMYGGCLGPLSLERPSPVEVLANHGYATSAFSSNPLLSRAYGYQRGFSHFSDLDPGEIDPALRNVKGGQILLRNPMFHYVCNLLGTPMRPGRLYVSATTVNQALQEWITKRSEPFFVWAHYMDIHWPYHLEEDLIHPKNIAQAWRDITHLHEINRKGASITPAQRIHFMRLYDRAVQYADKQIGRLLHWLGNSPYAENTLIIVVSDHGEEFLERNRWGHFETNLHDEIVKVPLIIRLPGQTDGQVVQHQVRTLDIMPTVLDLCSCPIPDGMEGRSLIPLWKGKDAEYEGVVALSERWRDLGDISHIVALRTEEFKYIWYGTAPDRPALFDLRTDPGEKHNVISQYPEITAQFQAMIVQHLERVAQSQPAARVIQPGLDKVVIDRLQGLGYLD